MRISIAFFTLLLLAPAASGQQLTALARHRHGETLHFSIADGSWVEYAVEVETLFGSSQTIVGRSGAVAGRVTWSSDGASGDVTVPVVSLDSGIPVRDRHVRQILGAGRFPELGFRVDRIRESEAAQTRGVHWTVLVEGELSVRGERVPVVVEVLPTQEGEVVTLDGSVALRFADLSMSPPRLLRFLKRAADELLLRAHLRAVLEDAPGDGLLHSRFGPSEVE